MISFCEGSVQDVYKRQAVTFVVWMALTSDVNEALTSAVAVLAISCPCALGLAERDAAFVFDRIAHNGLKCGQRYLFSPYATNTGPYFSTEEAV